jgi:ABC-type glycerol-3-phosphate transport system substrate-binding protein
MKRKLSGLLALMLAFGTTFGMTACGGAGATPDSENDLEIFYWNSGQGRVWLDNLIDDFEAANPTVNVVRNFRETNDTWEKELPNSSENTIDLYINSMVSLLAYTDYLEPLDDVMEATDENGTKLINKFDASLMSQLRKDGTLYGTYWGGGVCGLVYNKTVFEAEDLKMPRTTDELAALAADIYDIKDGKGNRKYTQFIFPGNADYWTYCY